MNLTRTGHSPTHDLLPPATSRSAVQIPSRLWVMPSDSFDEAVNRTLRFLLQQNFPKSQRASSKVAMGVGRSRGRVGVAVGNP